MTRRVLVTKSRTWTDATAIRQALAEVWGDGPRSCQRCVPPGRRSPRGAAVEQWGGQVERHPADWTRHGRAAGFRRNAAMAAAGIPTRHHTA